MRPQLNLAALILVGGCATTAGLSSYSSTVPGGIPYMLPKGVFDVAVTYTITEETKFVNGVPGKKIVRGVELAAAPRAAIRLVGDPTNRFMLARAGGRSEALFDRQTTLVLTDAGTIKTLGFEATDRVAETAQAIVGTLVQAAKILTLADSVTVRPTDSPGPCAGLERRTLALGKELLAATTGPDKDRLTRIKERRDELGIIEELTERCRAQNRVEATQRQVTYAVTIDPDDTTDFVTSEDDPRIITASVSASREFLRSGAAEIPVVQLRLILQQPRGSIKPFANQATTPAPGVVFRVPARVEVELSVGDDDVSSYDGDVLLPQFGGYAVGALTAARFNKRTTTVGFSESTGGLKEYAMTSTSSAAANASNLTNALANIQQGILDIRYGLPLQQARNLKELREAQSALSPVTANTMSDSTAALLKAKAFVEAQIELARAQRLLDSLKAKQ